MIKKFKNSVVYVYGRQVNALGGGAFAWVGSFESLRSLFVS